MSKLEDFVDFVKKNLPDFPESELDLWVKRNQTLIVEEDQEDCFNSIKNYYKRQIIVPDGYLSIKGYLFGCYNKIWDSERGTGQNVKNVLTVQVGTNKFMEFEHFSHLPNGVRELTSMPNLRVVELIYKEKPWASKTTIKTGITNELENIRIIESEEIIKPLESILPSMELTPMEDSSVFGGGKIVEITTFFDKTKNKKIPCSFYSNQELTCVIKFIAMSPQGKELPMFEGWITLKRMILGKKSLEIYNEKSMYKWLENHNTDPKNTDEENLVIINKQKHRLNDFYTNRFIWFLGKGEVKLNSDMKSKVQMNISSFDTSYLAIMKKPYIIEKEESEEQKESKEKSDVKDPGPIKKPKQKQEEKEEKSSKDKKITKKNVSEDERTYLTQLATRIMKTSNTKKPKDLVTKFADLFEKDVSEGLVKEIMEDIKNPEKSTTNLK